MTIQINNFFGKTIPYLLMANVFFIPINIKIAIPLIPILAFAWLLSGDWLDILKKLKESRYAILLASFWVLHAVGIFYTQNANYGFLDLQQKLSFLVFPLIFISSGSRIAEFKKWYLWVFVAGCIVSGLYLLGNAFYLSSTIVVGRFTFNPIPPDAYWENFFRYNRFSVSHHPSYIAMYFAFSISVIFSHLKTNNNGRSIIFGSVGIVFMYVLIILLSSRAGILVGTLAIVSGLFWLFFRRFKVAIAVVSVAFLIAASFIFIHYNSRFAVINQNIESIVDNDSETKPSSRDMRLEIWRTIPSAIGNNWLFGVGSGDTKEELKKAYKRFGMDKAVEEEFNAHNQYLQTLLALGVPGLLLLLVILVYPVYGYVKQRKDFLPVLFLGIVALNLLFESMLVRIAGVMFFAVFYCIFFAATPKRKYDFH
ncbi:MAG TPA: O-antigen ligase family protein [Tenuifilaceae bacterium]|nr:O-antigen ligase family protein [Tenuifilaceae bacterium]